MPAWSWVLALYSLQNIMMFTPWRRKGGGGEVSGRCSDVASGCRE